jgi:uncharacterized RDD family membrane protein YckC
MFCPRCGQSNEAAARFCQSCGSDLTAPAPVAKRSDHYAGFWKRFAAFLIDCVILSLATGLLTAGTLGVAWFAAFLLPWLYEAVMLSSERQATIGKIALGIIVTDLSGGRLSFGRATGRHFAKWISALILGIGFIIAAFTEKKQALHDMIAETLVVDSSSN